MALRGIRGATTVEEQTRDAVLSRTEELLAEILRSNPALAAEDIASEVLAALQGKSLRWKVA